MFESILAEALVIVSFEAPDYSCIQWLDPCSEVWAKIDYFYVCWLIADVMAREVVEVEADLMVLSLHLLVEISDPSVQWLSPYHNQVKWEFLLFEQDCSHPYLIVSIVITKFLC